MIDRVLARMAHTGVAEKVIKGITKRETLFNNVAPCIESLVCTGAYMFATATNKQIPDQQKPILQWQNVLNGALGIAISGTLNRWISKKGAQIIEHLDPKNIKKFSRVCDGIKVGLPILVTSLIMRWGISTLSVPMSDAAKKVCKLFHIGKDKDSKLDIKA